jgi:hypothetical protein
VAIRRSTIADRRRAATTDDDASIGGVRTATTMGAPASGGGPTSVTGHVWTTYGGWFADPKAWKRNTVGGFVALGALAMMTFNYSRAREKRPIYPAHAIPSQRWSGAFDANGPKAV